jgi:acyl carrier protein
VKNKKPPEVIKGSLKELSKTNIVKESDIPPAVKEVIISKLSELKGIKKEDLNLQSRLIIDCLCDSLDLAEMKSYTQVTFAASSNPSILELKTVGDLCMMAIGRMSNEKLKDCIWKENADVRSCLQEVELL